MPWDRKVLGTGERYAPHRQATHRTHVLTVSTVECRPRRQVHPQAHHPPLATEGDPVAYCHSQGYLQGQGRSCSGCIVCHGSPHQHGRPRASSRRYQAPARQASSSRPKRTNKLRRARQSEKRPSPGASHGESPWLTDACLLPPRPPCTHGTSSSTSRTRRPRRLPPTPPAERRQCRRPPLQPRRCPNSRQRHHQTRPSRRLPHPSRSKPPPCRHRQRLSATCTRRSAVAALAFLP